MLHVDVLSAFYLGEWFLSIYNAEYRVSYSYMEGKMGAATLLRAQECWSMLNLDWHDSPGALNSKFFIALNRSKSYLMLITSASIHTFMKCERYRPADNVKKTSDKISVHCDSYFRHFSTHCRRLNLFQRVE